MFRWFHTGTCLPLARSEHILIRNDAACYCEGKAEVEDFLIARHSAIYVLLLIDVINLSLMHQPTAVRCSSRNEAPMAASLSKSGMTPSRSPGLLALCHAHCVHQGEPAGFLRGWVCSTEVIIQRLKHRHTLQHKQLENLVTAASLSDN